MDPQQRLLLERGYLALVTGGLSRAEMKGGDFGVFFLSTRTKAKSKNASS